MEFLAATTDADSFTVPLFQRGKFNCASIQSLSFAEPVPSLKQHALSPSASLRINSVEGRGQGRFSHKEEL
jgi:hypothetical protein